MNSHFQLSPEPDIDFFDKTSDFMLPAESPLITACLFLALSLSHSAFLDQTTSFSLLSIDSPAIPNQ